MFKKILLGLGLLGVMSSANASYINIPTGYYDDGDNGMNYVKTPEQNLLAYANYMATPYGVMAIGVSSDAGSGLAGLVTSSAAVSHIPDGSKFGLKGCTVNSGNVYYCTSRGGSVVQPNIKSGTPPNMASTGYDDTALKNTDTALTNENNILKAKVQALETKVYQCIQ